MKKLMKVLALAIALSSLTMPLIAPTQAQTQISPAQELQKLLQQAVEQTEAGQLQPSLDTLQKALVLARRLKDTKTESEILTAIALTKTVIAAVAGSTPTAPPPQTSSLIEQGLQQTKLGEPNKAIATFEQALTLARQSKDKQTEATALLGIGLNYGNIGQSQKALEFYNQALPIFKATKNRGGEATALSNIGEIYRATGKPQKALEVLNVALPIFKEIRSRAQEGSTLNSIGAVYNNIGQPQKALEFYNQALLITREVNNPGQEATILNNLGKVYQETGEPQKALEYYNGALVASRQIGYASQEATTLNNIAGVYLATGQPQQALDALNLALPIVQKIGDRPKLAGTLNNLGEVYKEIGQPQKALEYYNQALPIAKEVGDRSGTGITLNNIAGTYLVTGNPQKALEFYNQALPIFKEIGNRTQEATTINNIGEVYNTIGQPQKALEYYNQALPIVKAAGDSRLEGTVLNNIGGIYTNIGQLQKALDFYNQALPLFKKVGDVAQESTTLNNIGVTYNALGQLEKALTYYNQALPILQKAGDRPVTATTLNNIGEVYRNLKQPQKALEFYNQALPIYKEVGDVSGEAVALNNIGLVYYQSKQQEQALTYYNQALPIVQKIGDTRTEAAIFGNIGTLYRDTNQPIEAIKNLEKAVEITLKIRSGLEKANRQQFLESSNGRGVGLISLLIDQNQGDRAYQWVNVTTTADLADYSRLIDAKVANLEAQKAIEQWNQSNRQLEILRQQLQAKFSIELSSQVDKLQTQVNQQAETIARRFPEVAELFETTPTDIAKLRANIPAGTVIIQPVLLTGVSNVPDTIALFVVTKDKVTVTKQPLDIKAFDALVTQYRQELTDVRFPKRFRATSTKLYDILIRPVEAQIAKATQLSIIATGKLRYIPFETLIDNKTGKYLIEKYPINNLTRLSSRSWQQPLNKKLNLLALGNPSPNDGRNLAGAEAEIKSITPLLPSQTYLKKQATLSNFRNQAPRFSILHLATHGCFQPQGCADLKMSANTLLFSDRTLNIADAALLGLKNTDLVVLSACQTALQTSSNGEEFAGIAYLFERAGARSAIASLWLAKDEETKQLMVEFYKNLKQGKTKGEALRSAKLILITKHPLYWSPFILIGDAH
ncbi:CHAT domain-containing protein [Synechocystis sp. PCC 7509]|uniref:CHAT domain-containing protein n=1 Tax=Synechocystis sp. PCC 7509 TaxID=927677 RepID=UPI0002ABE85D|nr:CHAT domain-containing protein [Synechocystis sp. PCC 7509]